MVYAGLSEVIGSWKIIAIRSPRRSAMRPSLAREQILAAKRQLRRRARAPRRQQPHQRERGQRLAAARFADEAQRLAALQREVHAAHGAQKARGRRNLHAQIVYL